MELVVKDYQICYDKVWKWLSDHPNDELGITFNYGPDKILVSGDWDAIQNFINEVRK